ncbi:MAG: DUF4342 domain-containing protein [Oscillochloris sp.]|nr:DUF4342 domain-containing protein [Oscillochloris sp.]
MVKEIEHLTGSRLLDRVRELVHKCDIQRIVIQDSSNRTVAEFPIACGQNLTPTLAATGAIAALLDTCTIEVIRDHGELIPDLYDEVPVD